MTARPGFRKLVSAMSVRSGSDASEPSLEIGELDEGSWDIVVTQNEDVHVTGTLVWYYFICRRQVWLMAHQINPDEDDPNLEYGRFLQRFSYDREHKEGSIGTSKVDIYRSRSGRLIVAEVKKSSRFLKSATMQMLFYLKQLRERGVEATGEIRVPDEKKKIPIELTEETRKQVEEAERNILEIIKREMPEAPNKVGWCRSCAYKDFCWS